MRMWMIRAGVLALGIAALMTADSSARGRRSHGCCNPCYSVPVCGYGYQPCYSAPCYPVCGPIMSCGPIIPGGGSGGSGNGGGGNGGGGQPQPKLKGKVHAVFAFDTKDSTIGKLCETDAKRLPKWFGNLPKDKVAGGAPKVITGDDFSPEKLQEAIKAIKADKDDCIFVFIGSHGLFDPKEGHMLVFDAEDDNPKKLARKAILDALKAKKTRLVVFITDACANFVEEEKVEREVTLPKDEPKRTMKDCMESLFLVPEGVVNFNACKAGQLSWGTGKGGSFMTTALITTTSRPWKDQDKNNDNRIDWGTEVFPDLQKRTDKLFKDAKGLPKNKGKEDMQKQADQTPFNFDPFPKLSMLKPRAAGVARVMLDLPKGANLTLDGIWTMENKNGKSILVSSVLSGNKTHTFKVTTELNGRTLTQKLTVNAGDQTTLRMGTSLAESMPMPKAVASLK